VITLFTFKYANFAEQLRSYGEGIPIANTLHSFIPVGEERGFVLQQMEQDDMGLHHKLMIFDETHFVHCVFVGYTEVPQRQESHAEFHVRSMSDIRFKSMKISNFGSAGYTSTLNYRDAEYHFTFGNEPFLLSTADASKYSGGKSSVVEFANELKALVSNVH